MQISANELNELKILIQKTLKERLKIGDNKQIYQFPAKNNPALTDLSVFSNEENSHKTVQTTWQNIFNLFTGNMPEGFYSPVITINSGINGSATLIKSSYRANNNSAGSMVDTSSQFLVTADDSGDLMWVTIQNPIPDHFSDINQAQLISFSIIKSSNIGITGAVGDGWKNDLSANLSGGVDVTFEGAEPSIEYLVSVSWRYQIQAALRRIKNVK